MINHTNPYADIDQLTVTEAIRQLRSMIAEEYEAANLYERFADVVSDDDIYGDLYEAIYDIANEERVHAGEFEYMIEYLQEIYGFDNTDDDLTDEGEEEAEETIKCEEDAKEVFGDDDEETELPSEQQMIPPTVNNIVEEGY